MKQYKILFITAEPLEHWTSANIRNLNLIEGLLACGYQVSTLSTELQTNAHGKGNVVPDACKRYFIPMNKVHALMTQKKQGRPSLPGKCIFALKKGIYSLKKKFTLYDTRKMEVPNVDEVEISEHFDLIISSSDPKSAHLFAERLIQKKPNIADKWIQYWGDPFTGDISKGYIGPEGILIAEEKRLLLLCDLAIYVSPLTAMYIQNKYKDIEDKVYFTPIPYSTGNYFHAPLGGIFKIGYFGDYTCRNRDIMPLYRAMSKLDNKYQLKIIGTSDMVLASTDNVEIFERVPANELRETERMCNLRVCICNRSGTQIPGKIYHASATDTPVLIILDGENAETIREYFEQYNRFYFCENNADSISSAIKIIAEKPDLHIQSSPVEAFSAKYVAQCIIRKVYE